MESNQSQEDVNGTGVICDERTLGADTIEREVSPMDIAKEAAAVPIRIGSGSAEELPPGVKRSDVGARVWDKGGYLNMRVKLRETEILSREHVEIAGGMLARLLGNTWLSRQIFVGGGGSFFVPLDADPEGAMLFFLGKLAIRYMCSSPLEVDRLSNMFWPLVNAVAERLQEQFSQVMDMAYALARGELFVDDSRRPSSWDWVRDGEWEGMIYRPKTEKGRSANAQSGR